MSIGETICTVAGIIAITFLVGHGCSMGHEETMAQINKTCVEIRK